MGFFNKKNDQKNNTIKSQIIPSDNQGISHPKTESKAQNQSSKRPNQSASSPQPKRKATLRLKNSKSNTVKKSKSSQSPKQASAKNTAARPSNINQSKLNKSKAPELSQKKENIKSTRRVNIPFGARKKIVKEKLPLESLVRSESEEFQTFEERIKLVEILTPEEEARFSFKETEETSEGLITEEISEEISLKEDSITISETEEIVLEPLETEVVSDEPRLEESQDWIEIREETTEEEIEVEAPQEVQASEPEEIKELEETTQEISVEDAEEFYETVPIKFKTSAASDNALEIELKIKRKYLSDYHGQEIEISPIDLVNISGATLEEKIFKKITTDSSIAAHKETEKKQEEGSLELEDNLSTEVSSEEVLGKETEEIEASEGSEISEVNIEETITVLQESNSENEEESEVSSETQKQEESPHLFTDRLTEEEVYELSLEETNTLQKISEDLLNITGSKETSKIKGSEPEEIEIVEETISETTLDTTGESVSEVEVIGEKAEIHSPNDLNKVSDIMAADLEEILFEDNPLEKTDYIDVPGLLNETQQLDLIEEEELPPQSQENESKIKSFFGNFGFFKTSEKQPKKNKLKIKSALPNSEEISEKINTSKKKGKATQSSKSSGAKKLNVKSALKDNKAVESAQKKKKQKQQNLKKTSKQKSTQAQNRQPQSQSGLSSRKVNVSAPRNSAKSGKLKLRPKNETIRRYEENVENLKKAKQVKKTVTQVSTRNTEEGTLREYRETRSVSISTEPKVAPVFENIDLRGLTAGLQRIQALEGSETVEYSRDLQLIVKEGLKRTYIERARNSERRVTEQPAVSQEVPSQPPKKKKRTVKINPNITFEDLVTNLSPFEADQEEDIVLGVLENRTLEARESEEKQNATKSQPQSNEELFDTIETQNTALLENLDSGTEIETNEQKKFTISQKEGVSQGTRKVSKRRVKRPIKRPTQANREAASDQVTRKIQSAYMSDEKWIFAQVPKEILLGGITLFNNLTKQMRASGTLKVETLMSILGALAGYSAQEAVREKMIRKMGLTEEQVFSVVETKDSQKYYFGDSIDQYLQQNRDSIWNMAASATARLTGRVDSSIDEIMRYNIRNLGSDNFGIPRLPSNLKPSHLPEYYVSHMWGTLRPGLDKFTDDPFLWPLIFSVAIQRALILTASALDPNISLKIILESAAPMAMADVKLINYNSEQSELERLDYEIFKLKREIEYLRSTLTRNDVEEKKRRSLTREYSRKTERYFEMSARRDIILINAGRKGISSGA